MVPLKIVKCGALIYYTAKRVGVCSLTLSRKLVNSPGCWFVLGVPLCCVVISKDSFKWQQNTSEICVPALLLWYSLALWDDSLKSLKKKKKKSFLSQMGSRGIKMCK